MAYSSGFQQYYRCYPVSSLKSSDKTSANYGGKIILPQSALSKLTMLHISYPMLFEIRNGDTGRTTHAGVLEFTAEEGRAYLPQWMLDTLGLNPSSLIKVTNISIVLGSFVKLEPQSVDFLEITDPKAVLENALRNFSTLSVDDIFQISYNDHIYRIRVLEVKPVTELGSVSIVETDLEVDFAPPVGYVEPTPTSKASAGPVAKVGPMAKAINYAGLLHPRKDKGVRIGGKAVEETSVEEADVAVYKNYSAPALELPEGQLFFGYPYLSADAVDQTEEEDHFKGEGNRLRQNRKRKDLS